MYIPRILVCVADSQVLSILDPILQAHSECQWIMVDRGAEALRSLLAQTCDLMILDLDLPGMPRTTFLGAVRKVAPTLPLLVLSTSLSVQEERDVREKGVLFYVVKPLSGEEMNGVIAEAIGHVKRGLSS